MKIFFAFLTNLYNELLYNGICRRFRNVVEYFPELGGGIQILEIGFGKGNGKVTTISPYKVGTPWAICKDEPMYFAEVQSMVGEKGYLYAVRRNSSLVRFFYTGKKQEEIDFSFEPEGIITKDGIKCFLAGSDLFW